MTSFVYVYVLSDFCLFVCEPDSIEIVRFVLVLKVCSVITVYIRIIKLLTLVS